MVVWLQPTNPQKQKEMTFKCKLCGYIHEGDAAPDKCPMCLQPGEMFEEIKEETPTAGPTATETTPATEAKEEEKGQRKFKCKICGYIHTGDKAPDKCPMCLQTGDIFEEITPPTADGQTATAKKKRLDTNANSYIIMYSCVMVIIVAFLLAFISSALKPTQDINVALDKKKQVLAALNIRGLDNEASAAKYAEVVQADAVIDAEGKTLEEGTQGGEEAGFKLSSADYKAGRLAIYICNVEGKKKYVVPVYGMGLWGPIWGYIAVNEDGKTVFGAYFNHESETAGLGAEIKDSKAWQDKFMGKTIYDATGTPVLKVLKASEVKDTQTQIDAVTGATLTSNGVSDMLIEGFGKYREYFKLVSW